MQRIEKFWYGNRGGSQSARVEVCCLRWGGGAAPGKTHVFAIDDSNFFGSAQCVVDDFGNLVAVP
ncbi:MAG: hypothetical protein V4645_27780 [Pseudomonadota bacterium]